MGELEEKIRERLAPKIESECHYGVEMRERTTFCIGGPADCIIELVDFKDLGVIMEFVREEDVAYMVMGKGSNLLVSDRGIRGVVVQIDKGVSRYWVEGARIRAESGMSVKELSRIACERGLSGLEFCCGIPGNIGGAIYMNAGAYGGEMAKVVERVRAISEDGSWLCLGCDEMGFAYRRSVLQERELIVSEVVFKLERGVCEAIECKMEELRERREGRQPLDCASGGSTFRRPKGGYAGELIAKAGLQGYSIGGAEVSKKHAGFIVNKGGATCGDVLGLMEKVQSEVYKKFGVMLEPEIKVVGEF